MKTFLSLAVLVSMLAIVWYYIPLPARDKVVAFIGGALERDSKEFPALIRDRVLPKNPEKEREVLLGELKQKLEEVKTIVSEEVAENASGDTSANISAADLISQSEEIIKALEEANQEKPGIADKILEKIFPVVEKQVCKEP